MRKVRQVLRMKWEKGLSNRQIAGALKMGKETVREYLRRAEAAGLSSWQDVAGISEGELNEMLFPSCRAGKSGGDRRRAPDWSWIHKELSGDGVTLRLLWKEYMEESPETA